MEDNRLKDESISNSNLENNRKNRNSNPVGRPKGLPKTGGRKKNPDIEEKHKWDDILKSNLFNIPQEAIKLYFDKQTSNALKFSILQFLAQYTTPSIKPIDKSTDEEEQKIESSPSDLITLVKND